MMAERNISLSNWPSTALYICVCVLIYKQHLSSPYINVWSSTQTMSTRLRAAVCTVVIWTTHPCGRISDKKHSRPLSDSQHTRFLWTDKTVNSTEEQPLPPFTATGGQPHARPSHNLQMSPDKRRVRGQSRHLLHLWPVYFHILAVMSFCSTNENGFL